MSALRKLAIALGGATTFCAGVSLAIVCASPAAPAPVRLNDTDRLRVFDAGAAAFEAHVEAAERAFGVGMEDRRRALVARARGHVVEVCAGAGRNTALYPGGLASLTLVDFAPGALALAAARQPPLGAPVPRVLVADSHALPLPDASADTVVDTFGLCSLRDPQGALAEWARLLRPGGELLLLEHGRSGWCAPVNFVLDRGAGGHERQWGCAWNLDVEKMVRGAAGGAGLDVVGVTRHHWGTTTALVLRKRAGATA